MVQLKAPWELAVMRDNGRRLAEVAVLLREAIKTGVTTRDLDAIAGERTRGMGAQPSFLGYVDLGTLVDLGSTCYVETSGINKQVTVPAGGKMFGYLVTNGGYTPTAQSVKKITLHSVAV